MYGMLNVCGYVRLSVGLMFVCMYVGPYVCPSGTNKCYISTSCLSKSCLTDCLSLYLYISLYIYLYLYIIIQKLISVFLVWLGLLCL